MKRTYITAFAFLALLSIFGCGGRAGVTAPPVFTALATSFEPADWPLGTTDFTDGTAPESAHFTNGITLTIGVPSAYRSGIASWGILNLGAVGTIDFDTPASSVSFYAINAGGASGMVQVFDQNDVLIPAATMTIVETNMMMNSALVSFTAVALGVTGISKVTVTNSNGAGHQVWIDEFSSLQPLP